MEKGKGIIAKGISDLGQDKGIFVIPPWENPGSGGKSKSALRRGPCSLTGASTLGVAAA